MSRYKTTFLLNNVKDDMGRLQMRIQWDGQMLAFNVGYVVNVAKWNNITQMCVANTTHGPKHISAMEINREIKRHIKALDDALLTFNPTYAPTKIELKDAIDVALGKKVVISKELVKPVLSTFIIRQSQLEQWAHNTSKGYRTLLFSLESWRKDTTFADLGAKGLEDYYLFLMGEGKNNVTTEKYIVNTKAFLKWAQKNGHKVDPTFNDFEPHVKSTRKTIVWLSWEELLRLYKAKFGKTEFKVTDERLRHVRDIFCLSCFTGMRYSDLATLRHSQIVGDKIHLPIVKTTEPVVIELNKYSRAILDRYKDYDPVYALPQISNPVCNRVIKDACKHIGIDTPTTITYYSGSKRVQETKPKYDLITMHTGRRTFICNALEKGISPSVVMKWTGHSDYAEMKPYIDISDRAKESAMKLFDK